MSRTRPVLAVAAALASVSLSLAGSVGAVSAAPAAVSSQSSVSVAATSWAGIDVKMPKRIKAKKPLRVALSGIEKKAKRVKLYRLVDGKWVRVSTSRVVKGKARVVIPKGTVDSRADIFKVVAASRSNVFVVDTDLRKLRLSQSPGKVNKVSGVVYATQVNLSWTAASGATTYLVELSTDGGASWQHVTDVAAYKYNVTGLTDGVDYLFRVSGLNGDGAGAPGFFEATTQPNVPAAITGLKATPTDSTVTLDWANAARATSYRVEQTCSENVEFEDAVCPVDSREVTPSKLTWGGLRNGVEYRFRVTGLDQDGAGPAAQVVSTPMAKPAAVTNVVPTAGNAAIFARWTPSATAEDYRIAVAEQGSTTWQFSDWSALNNAKVAGLKNGTAYQLRVYARNAYGTTVAPTVSSIVPSASAPNAPENLSASPGDARVVLTWDADPTASSYVVMHREVGMEDWVSTISGGFVTDSAAGTVTRSVGNLVNGVNYEFEVYATNQSGRSAGAFVEASPHYNGDYPRFASPSGGAISSAVKSASSGAVSAASTALPAPSVIATVTATPYSARAYVAWTASANATSYEVSYSTSPSGPWTSFATVPYTQRSVNVTGLTNGTAYYVQVVPVNDTGAAAATSAGPVTPIAVPGVVTNIQSLASNESIFLDWNEVATATKYRVMYKPTTSSSWAPPLYVDAPVTEYTIIGLTNGTAYNVAVSGVNSSGSGTNTNAGPTTPSADVPTAVTNVTVTPGNGQVALSWDSVDDAYGYQVFVSGANGLTSAPPSSVPVGSEDYTVTGLTNGNVYTFTVVAYNDYGVSSPYTSEPVTPGVNPPSAPTSLVATPTDGGATIAFTPGADGGAAIVNYAYSLNNGPFTPLSPSVSTSPVSITGLTNGTTYSIELAAVNTNGQVGAASSAVSVTPTGDVVDAPTGLSATPADGGATIAFTQTGVPSGATVSNYNYSLDGGNTWTALSPAATASPITVTGLTNGTTYSVTLQTVLSSGVTSPASSAVSVTPATVPSAPTDFQTLAGDGVIEVAFTPGADGGAAITNYVYSTDGGATWTPFSPAITDAPGTITATSASGGVTALTNGTTYTVAVAAVNAAGQGVSSATSTATPVAVPAAVTGYTLTPGNGTLEMNWDAVTGADSYTVSLTCASNTTFSLTAVGCPVVSDSTDDTTYTWSGLTNGVTYAVSVAAANGAGPGAATTLNGTPATTPSAPTNLVATGVDSAAVISFTPGANGGAAITNYVYSDDSGSTWTALSPAQATQPITISGLTNGTAYTFQIAAVNSAGQGVSSTSVTVTPASNPDAPSGLTATPGDGQVVIDFTPGSDGGSAITNYNYTTDGGSTWAAFSPAVTDSPVTITGLTNGTTYEVGLQAVNGSGPSTASETVVVTPSTVPSAPTSLTATAGDGQLSVTFTPGSDGGSPITNYAYSLNGGALTPLPIPDDSSPVVITGLDNGTAYTVQLAAINANGTSAASAAAAPVTPFGAPLAPTAVTPTASNAALSLAFTAADGNGSAVTAYEYSTDGGSSWTSTGTASPIAISGLSNGTAYTVGLRAVNAAGVGDVTWVGPDNSTTPFTNPAAPVIDNVTAGNAQVTVDITAGDDGGLPITNYQYSLNGGASWTALSPAADASPLTITGLTNGTAYTVAVQAINAGGAVSATSNISGAFTPYTNPSAPTNLAATAGNGSASIAFTPAVSGGYPIANYVYTLDGGSSQTAFSPAVTTSPVTITGLTNGTAYTVQMAAVDSQGNQSPWSASVTVTPEAPATAPSAPTSVSVAVTSSTTAALSWIAPTNDGGADLTSYTVSVSPASGVTITPAAFPGTTATLSNLTPGVTYTAYVTAANEAGDSPAAASPTFNTGAMTPEGLASSVSYNDVVYTWDAVDGATGYELAYCSVPTGSAACDPTASGTGVSTTSTSYSFTGNWSTDYYVTVLATAGSITGAPSDAVIASIGVTPTLVATSGGYGSGAGNAYTVYATGQSYDLPDNESLITMVNVGGAGWAEGTATPTISNGSWSWSRLVSISKGGAAAYWQFDLGNDTVTSNTISWSW